MIQRDLGDGTYANYDDKTPVIQCRTHDDNSDWRMTTTLDASRARRICRACEYAETLVGETGQGGGTWLDRAAYFAFLAAERAAGKRKELDKRTKTQLVIMVKRYLIGSANPPEKWRKDELIEFLIQR